MLQRVAAALRPLQLEPDVSAPVQDLSVPEARVAASDPVLSPVHAVPLTADEREYLDFYGINCEREFPGLRHCLGYVESCERRLAVHVLRQPQATRVLLLVHGYLDHVGLFGHLIRFGLQRGYTVVAFDLPGHGLSAGDRVSIEDFSDYRRALEDILSACRCLPGSRRVIAQSTGGAAVLDYLIQGGSDIERVVMLAPLVRPRGWFWVLPAHVVLHRFKDSVRRKFAENSNDPEFLEWIRTDPLQSESLSIPWIGALRRWIKALPREPVACEVPLLLIQGDADATVDWRYNVKRIQQLISSSRVEYLAGGRHHLANESLPVRQSVYALVDEFFA